MFFLQRNNNFLLNNIYKILPEPVFAIPIKSIPFNAIGQAVDWIGVGFKKFAFFKFKKINWGILNFFKSSKDKIILFWISILFPSIFILCSFKKEFISYIKYLFF